MRVLQIGRDDWSASALVPEGVDWVFIEAGQASSFEPALIGPVEATIVDAPCGLRALESIDELIAPYTLLIDWPLREVFGAEHQHFFTRKAVVFEDLAERQAVMEGLPRRFFARPFGEKLGVRAARLSPYHRGAGGHEGNTALAAELDREGECRQIVMWRENIRYENDRALELWPEFTRDPGCELELHLQLVQNGSPEAIVFHRAYSEAELAEPIVFDHPVSGHLSASFFARGHGRVRIGPLHYRRSRLGTGHFLPGGRRIVDHRREELFTYFHPGDLTPPFNVYFAGYRPSEGFEGYYLMASLGHPFLLVSDPRLEGGRFYLGSAELEGKLLAVIREHIEALGLGEEDVIFSGLSMGAFGALHYGAQFRAHAIIAGKPIIDLGHLAGRARLERPKDFLTSLDVVNFWDRDLVRTTGTIRDPGSDPAAESHGAADPEGTSDPLELLFSKDDPGRDPDLGTHPVRDRAAVDAFTRELVARWHGEPGFGDTRILLTYMQDDDYDDTAYVTLLASQTGKPTTVIARGYPGRHDDDSASIVTWFSNQYRRVISEYQEGRDADSTKR
ncbi:accessory Sec system protein Asp2 [Leucobacter massiliensis]|uniref:Accessory Sec system protein Asp2 n=1 Tax=Leucobacter massiliensis TaxID=1686285 RepID=A0A2S9QR86_9MICO|nr:accessory Sec system protein Asp2 [Leucobacter massiliensis]PRI12082.1 accessory Sec system protein Asp2 [Leucobacter massiliensis]